MPEAFAGSAALQCFLTGAASHNGSQSDPNASLGNYRSSTPAEFLTLSIGTPIANVDILEVSAACGPGTHTLKSLTASSLTFIPDGGEEGDAVAIADGETKTVCGADSTKWIRVQRTSTAILTGECSITAAIALNDVVGFDNVSSAERTAGLIEYRCLAIVNQSDAPVENVGVYLPTYAGPFTTSAAFLPASGAGSLGTAMTLNSWPDFGMVRIAQAGGAMREAAYYPSRSSSALTVPSNCRGLQGTSAVEGASNDTAVAIPPIAVGWDPATGNLLESVATETDAPAGVTFSLPIASAPLSVGAIPAGALRGLWFRRQLPPGATTTPALASGFRLAFDAA